MYDLRTLRLNNKIKLNDIAEKLNIDLSTYKKVERGFVEPNDDILIKLASLYQVPKSKISIHHKNYIKNVIPGEGYTTSNNNKNNIICRQKALLRGKINILDLFCGCGGFSYGFDQLAEFQITCGIDLLYDRIKTFSVNHLYANSISADLRYFPINEILNFSDNPDIIIGGPPCQGFSSIRPFRKLTEFDKRNNLLEIFVFIIGSIKPKWFLFENVIGLINHQNGNIFNSLIQNFKDTGYHVEWKILNYANFGVPQNRERVFIVGNRLGYNFDWPQPTHNNSYKSMAGNNKNILRPIPLFDGVLPPPITINEAIHDLPPIEAGQKSSEYLDNVVLTNYEKNMRQESKNLTSHVATNHSNKMIEIIRHAGKNINNLPEGMTSSGFSSCYSRLDYDKPSTTITVNFVHPASNRCIHPTQNRALTPREGARLQGFPDRFEFVGNKTQIVKQIGNAVSPIISNIFAKNLREYF